MTLVYDAENRLQQVKQGSTVLASYTVRQAQGRPYDADGNRVTAVMGSSTTVYIGATYEKTTSGGSTTITKYYQAGGQRIALRVNGVVRWLATDHPSTVLRTGLGSTSITASEAGARIAELRYKPWGENRYTFGATPTQRRFTGQVLDEVAGGLYFYNARYYDPALGRFAQADTIVPSPQNPQNLNRYNYVGNRPTVYRDPTGHAQVCGSEVDGGCGGLDALHTIESLLMQGKLDPLAAKQAYFRYYLTHPTESPDGYHPLTRNPAQAGELKGMIMSTAYAQAMAASPASNLGGVVLDSATTNGVIFEAMSGYGGKAALAAGMTALSGGFLIYKKGPDSDMNLTPRPGKDTDIMGGLSFFDSPTNPNMQIQKGEKYLAVDATKLNELQVINDNDPPGHFTVRPGSQGVLLEWAATRGTGTVHRLTEELRRAIQFIDKWR